jgi:hypothetical protein
MQEIKSKWKQCAIHQLGEYLVTVELCRRGFSATPFAGNLPYIDIIVVDRNGHFIPVQVKTIKYNSSWQFDVQDFADVEFQGIRQRLKARKDPPWPNLICVLVQLGRIYGEDEFFILNWEKLRDLIYAKYNDEIVERRGGIRRINPKSTHSALYPRDLYEYKDKWEIFENK